MYLVEVVPLTKIPMQKPQVLSYFSSQPFPAGSLVSAPLGKRYEKAMVIETHQIKDHKMEIKKAEYELRPIKKVLSPEPIVTKHQIKLSLWLSQYYFTSPGLFMKMMIPKKFSIFNFQFLNKSQTNRQKLILVPKVSQIESVAKNYPENKTVIIHSGLNNKKLTENWQKIATGQVQIIIGTRTAVFAPFLNLKEIIIEDETNPHHRSWDMFPHYRVHEVAQKLTEIFEAVLRIEGGMPSIESYFLSKNFCHPEPPAVREGSRGLPQTHIIDLRQELREGNFSIFSRKLQQLINEVLKSNQQIILFINRRGAATFVLCRDCGYVAKCPNCDAPMTYHLTKNKGGFLKPALICHHCGQKSQPPSLCPQCQSYKIKVFGTGTQRVEMEAKKLFPMAKIQRMDSDIAETPIQQQKIIQEFKDKKTDILIGTQMILNEDLPKVPLLAIISADTLLHLPDFRSGERLFQTINQLKKFTNRQLIIQTYNPDSSSIILAVKNDFKSFYQQEIETRKILKYPPFSQLIKLAFRHQDPKKAFSEAKILFAKLSQQIKISKNFKEVILEIIGPAPAFIPKEKQKYIWQIIIKAKSIWLAPQKERDDLLRQRNQFLMTVPSNWEIDVDPETLL